MTRVVYLHGFASSPHSSKAQFFRRKFAARGVPMEIPRLDEGRFEELTISGQLRGDRTGRGRPACDPDRLQPGRLSRGALCAVVIHSRSSAWCCSRPPSSFPGAGRERYSHQDWERWKREGSTPVFHYGDGRERRLGYQFVEDAAQYEDEPEFPQPALILHGVRDSVVPAEISRVYAARHPNTRLVLFESGHELTDVLEPMWLEVSKFLSVPESIETVSKLTSS